MVEFICHTCYRSFPEERMKPDISMGISDMCRKCYQIIGKGTGYSDTETQKEAEKWFNELQGRKQKLIDEGKIVL